MTKSNRRWLIWGKRRQKRGQRELQNIRSKAKTTKSTSFSELMCYVLSPSHFRVWRLTSQGDSPCHSHVRLALYWVNLRLSIKLLCVKHNAKVSEWVCKKNRNVAAELGLLTLFISAIILAGLLYKQAVLLTIANLNWIIHLNKGLI